MTFMRFLEVPSPLIDGKSLCCMIVLLFPIVVKRKRNSQQYLPELESYFSEIGLASYEVFQENNVRKRHAFFNNPLI